MPFVTTVPDDDGADGAVKAMYDADRRPDGGVPNYTRVFSARPEVYAAWKGLNAAVKGPMDPRRYELVSIAAARKLGSTYCAVAHSALTLREGFAEAETLQAEHHGTAPGLDAVDVAVMDLAEKVAADASAVTQADIDRLRDLGLTDEDVFDVVAAAAMRCFFAKVLDGLGAQADAHFADRLGPELTAALTVGRPVAEV